jgi:hypothetical protein
LSVGMFGQDMFLPVPPVGIEINQEIATGRRKLLGKNMETSLQLWLGQHKQQQICLFSQRNWVKYVEEITYL